MDDLSVTHVKIMLMGMGNLLDDQEWDGSVGNLP